MNGEIEGNFVIKIEALVKKFGDKEAVKNVSFEVAEGEIFGFLGPNGAGKTTIVKMLNGLIRPNAGKIDVLGYDPILYPEKIHALAGTLTETAGMYEQMTGNENLVFFSKLFGIEDRCINDRIEVVLHQVDLYEHRNVKLKYYSTGMKKKLSLARIFIHRPKLLILDEPTSGLDPESAKRINKLISDYVKKRHATVFLCTHQLRYAQDICTKYGFINEGKLICTGNFSEILNKCNLEKYLYLYAKLDKNDRFFDDFEIDSDRYKVPIVNKEEVSTIVKKIVLSGGNIFEAKICEPSLEELYFLLVERKGFYE